MRAGLPGLVGGLELDKIGHWVQHEAADLRHASSNSRARCQPRRSGS
jgi:hypothetical protein